MHIRNLLASSMAVAGLFFTAAFLATGAVAYESHHPVAVNQQQATSAVTRPITARFVLRVGNKKTDWYLWREPDFIETANILAGESSLWRRTGTETYHYERIFHREQRIVDYVPGELKTRQVQPDWQKLGSVISPELLGELKRVGKKILFGQPAIHYTGSTGGQKIDVWWLEEAQLPARLTIDSPKQRMTMTLKQIESGSPTGWPRVDAEKISNYLRIDAADFGDMESDPFVARLLAQEGHVHTH